MSQSDSDLASMSRAAQRRLRLLEAEKQQRLEDLEALKMTEEQRQILWRSFRSVKVEFCDLDGLSWTRSALCRHYSDVDNHIVKSQPMPDRHNYPHIPAAPQPAFAVLTNTDIGLLSAPEEASTVRASRGAQNLSQSISRSRSPVKAVFTDGISEGISSENNMSMSCHDNSANSHSGLERDPIGLAQRQTGSIFLAPPPSDTPSSASNSSTKETSGRMVQPILVINSKGALDDDDDDLKTPLAPYSSIREPISRGRTQSGGLKRKR